MSNVIQFPGKGEPSFEEHITGDAHCLGCKHEWVAVIPVGVNAFECPSCHGMQGLMKGLCMTKAPQCKCGCWHFYLDPEGPYCALCGLRPSPTR